MVTLESPIVKIFIMIVNCDSIWLIVGFNRFFESGSAG